MRFGVVALFLMLCQRIAVAHVPGSEQTVVERLGHQLIGLHHLPVSALLALVVIVVTRHYLLRRSSGAS